MSEPKPSDRAKIVKQVCETVVVLAIVGAMLYSCTRDREPVPAAASVEAS